MTPVQQAVAFRCDKDTLADKLTLAFRATPAKTMQPAHAGVLLEAEGDRVTLTATDGELTIRTSLAAQVDAPGEVVLHRLFGDVIRSLPAGAVELAVDSAGTAQVASGRSRFSLRTYPRTDYPVLPEAPAATIELAGPELANAIEQVVPAASNDRARPILMGVLLAADDGGMRLVATDSYRLAIRELALSGFLGDGETALLPARALGELSRLVLSGGAEATVSVGTAEQRVVFVIGDTQITATRIDGEFPSYQQLIPERYPNRFTAPKQALLDALRRVALIGRDATPVRLSFGGDEITMQAIDAELGGEAVEGLDAAYEGEPMTIAFNSAYLRDGLEAVAGDEITLETVEPLKPAMLSATGDSAYRYLLMPVRV